MRALPSSGNDNKLQDLKTIGGKMSVILALKNSFPYDIKYQNYVCMELAW